MKISKPLIFVTLYSVFWAFFIIASRFVLKQGINPLLLTAQQSIFASIFLLPFFIRKINTLKQTSKASIAGALIVGCLGSGLGALLSQFGIKLSSSVNYGFLITTSTLFAVIFARIFLKEPISKNKRFLLLLIFFGAFLLSTGGKLIIPHVGDLYILIAAACFGLTANISRLIIKKDIYPDLVSFFRIISAAIFIGSITLLAHQPLLSFNYLLPVIFVGFLQALCLIFLNKTYSVASVSYATMMSMITPVIVAIIAYPLFGERLTLIQSLGALAIVSGGILTQVKKVAHHN